MKLPSFEQHPGGGGGGGGRSYSPMEAKRESEKPMYLKAELSLDDEQFAELREAVLSQYKELGAKRGLLDGILSYQGVFAVNDLGWEERDRLRQSLPENNSGVYSATDHTAFDLTGRFSAVHPTLASGNFWLYAINPSTSRAIIGYLGAEVESPDDEPESYHPCFAAVIDVTKRHQEADIVIIPGDDLELLPKAVELMIPHIQTQQEVPSS